jgi:hypothetical protein
MNETYFWMETINRKSVMSKNIPTIIAASAALKGGAVILLISHTLGGAVAGGTAVGVGTFYLVNKFIDSRKKNRKPNPNVA